MRFQNVFLAAAIPICFFTATARASKGFLDSLTSFLVSSAPNLDPLHIQSSLISASKKKPLTFKELAAKYGYPAKEYAATTEDGYKLTVFRLQGKRKALPVLLFHGLADSSDTWIIRGHTSLAITLVRAGYDVWLANNRGNKYSRGHVSLDPDVHPSYWKFSFHEIGLYDVSATIDLVLHETGASKLNAFGHSQGNTIFFVLLSTRPEYNAKINVVTALAPVCYLQNVPPPIGILIQFSPTLQQVTQDLGVTNVLGVNSPQTIAFKTFSQIPVIGYAIDAYGFLFAVCGEDKEEFEPEFLAVVGLYFPTWTSTRNLVHFAQVGLRNVFAQFDYGTAGNNAAYNSTVPPQYDLRKIVAKVALLSARNDKFSILADVTTLRQQLPNVVKDVVIPRNQMNHLDYVWGRNAHVYLYPYIFDILENYN